MRIESKVIVLLIEVGPVADVGVGIGVLLARRTHISLSHCAPNLRCLTSCIY